MKKYQSYKPSGVEWIGDIPENWNLLKLKHEYKIQKGRIPKTINEKEEEGLVPYLSMEVLRGSETSSYVSNEDGVFVKEGQILILWDGSNSGEIIKVEKEGILSSTMGVLNKIGDKLHEDFSFYQLKSHEPEIRNNTNGMGIPHVDGQYVRSLFLLTPPLQEQEQIVKYLDEKTSIIDKLISTKERKIELLKEQRTSLINQVITKGLNPNVNMKDSGVEWIGEIPEGWEMIKLRYLGKSIIGLSYTPDDIVEDESEGLLVLRSSNIQNGKLSLEDNVYVKTKVKDELLVKKGDILLCSRNGSKSLIGKNIVIDENMEGNTFGVFMTLFRSINWKFLSYVFNSQIFKNQSGVFLTSTINQLTQNTLNSFIIPFTKDKLEQEMIFEFLNKHTKEIDDLVSMEQKKIELLKEYRQSLISEVITGKIKVVV